jgi:hypothetical protein
MQLDLLGDVNFSGPNARASQDKAEIKYDGKLIMAAPGDTLKQARFSISFAKFCAKTGLKPKTVAFGFTKSNEAVVVFDEPKYGKDNLLISTNYIVENKARIIHIFDTLKIVTPTKEMPVVTCYFTLVEVIKGAYRVEFNITDDINAEKVERVKRPFSPGSSNF